MRERARGRSRRHGHHGAVSACLLPRLPRLALAYRDNGLHRLACHAGMRLHRLRARAAMVAVLAVVTGACATPLGNVAGLLGAEAYPPAMVLATGTTGEDCGSSVLFVPLSEPRLDTAIARAVASVPEATLLTDVRVERVAVTTGLYNRSCVRVRGSAAKLVSQLVLPAEGHHHGAHASPH
jgi:hypothetical protein